MTKRQKKGGRRPSRLDRIERKCDRILTEIIMFRHRSAAPVADALDRLHCAARRMRELCEGEYIQVRNNLHQGRR